MVSRDEVDVVQLPVELCCNEVGYVLMGERHSLAPQSNSVHFLIVDRFFFMQR